MAWLAESTAKLASSRESPASANANLTVQPCIHKQKYTIYILPVVYFHYFLAMGFIADLCVTIITLDHLTKTNLAQSTL